MKKQLLIYFSVLHCIFLVSTQNNNITDIAIGGTEAESNEFPYMVSFQRHKEHFCGAALISDSHVLTAAHCVVDIVQNRLAGSFFTVEVGSNKIGSGVSYGIKRISYNKKFINELEPYFVPNDIAVITLSQPVQFSPKVGKINLPWLLSRVKAGTNVTVTGFGLVKEGEKSSPVLRKLNTTIISYEACKKYYSTVKRTNICAQRGETFSTCSADSGGPVVTSNKKTIVGVVSGGGTPCGVGTPDIYTKVSDYILYIRSEMVGFKTDHPAINYSK